MYNSTLGTNRSLLCFPFCSRERNVRATECKEITDSLGSFHAVDSSFQVPEFTFLVSGTWIQASQSFAEFRIPKAKIFHIRESGSPDIGRTIQIRGKNFTFEAISPAPHIRCSIRVPTSFPFRPTQKNSLQLAVCKKCS